MKKSRWMWRAAIGFWLVALLVTALPASAQVGKGGELMQFSFGQVVILCAVGMAWGDQRARVDRLEKVLEKHMDKCAETHS